MFVPSDHEVLTLLDEHRRTRRITHYHVPRRQLDELKAPVGDHVKWTDRTVVELLQIHRTRMEVYLRDVVSGQMAWERLGALYLSEFVTAAGQPLAPTPVQDRRPLEIPVDVNADIRAREFAHLVVTHCHTCVGKYIATLDGRLRNAAHLVRHGVRPSTVLVIEREPRVAFFQRLVQRGTDVEEVRVELGDMRTYFLTESRRAIQQNLVALNLDFCGSVPNWVTPRFCAQFEAAAIWGFTAGLRNNTRTARGRAVLPVLPGMTECRTYHHGQVDSQFLVKDRTTCAETVPVFAQTYHLLDIIARWASTRTNSDGPGRLYFLGLYRDADGVLQGDWFEDVELADEARELADAWGRRERAQSTRTLAALVELPSTQLELAPEEYARIRAEADRRYGVPLTPHESDAEADRKYVVGHTEDGTLFAGHLADAKTIHLLDMDSLHPLWTTTRGRRMYAAATRTRTSHRPQTLDMDQAYILQTFDQLPSVQSVTDLVNELNALPF